MTAPSSPIPMYACVCGARDEGEQPAKCWNCGGKMTRYGTRTPHHVVGYLNERKGGFP